MENYYKLCLVIYNGQNHSILGRTMIQKIIYFCREFGWNPDYRFNYFGPVSFEVRNLLSSLIAADIISKEEDDNKLPIFKLTNDGLKFFKEYSQYMKIDKSMCDKIAKLTNYLTNTFEKDDLMRASIVSYVNYNEELKRKDLIKKVNDIHTDADEKQAVVALKNLHKIQAKIREIAAEPMILNV